METNIKTTLVFQHLGKGKKRPDDITLSDVPTLIDGHSIVPNVGDIVTQQMCRSDDKLKLGCFKVVGKNYWYTRRFNSKNGNIGKITQCCIIVIVAPVDGDEIGVDIKQ